MNDDPPSADEVRAYCQTQQCGVLEAKRALMAQWRRRQWEELRTLAVGMHNGESCREALVRLLDVLIVLETRGAIDAG